MEIRFSTKEMPLSEDVIRLYERAAMPRPTNNKDRISTMFRNSNLVITAWHQDTLVGVCRCLTDWVWCCYLSDLAVDPDYKQMGIGRKLLQEAKKEIGDQSMILLISVLSAVEYYPKVGFEKEEWAFIQKRAK